MMENKKNVTRKNSPPIKVYCLPSERKQIEKQAGLVGMSVGAYLRNIGMGYEVTGIVDAEQVRELARINGDLGRLGGLLKLWLTNDVRTAQFGEATIRALLSKIESTQDELGKVMLNVIMPKAKK
jgi:hypothetical protein